MKSETENRRALRLLAGATSHLEELHNPVDERRIEGMKSAIGPLAWMLGTDNLAARNFDKLIEGISDLNQREAERN